MVSAGRTVMLLLGVTVAGVAARAQFALPARVVGMAAATASVRDTRGFPLNPAGIVGLRDWEFTMTTYHAGAASGNGFVFHGLTFGKRFLDDEALAVQYAPGTQLRFVTPLSFGSVGGAQPAGNDREITYAEPFALAAAHRFSPGLSVGVGGRYRRQKVNDTEFRIVVEDTIAYPLVTEQHYGATTWFVDAAVSWSPTEQIQLALVGTNLARIGDRELPAPVSALSLPSGPFATLGASAALSPAVRLAVDASTIWTGGAGAEWSPARGVALRGGIYLSAHETPALYGFGVGLGLAYEFLEFDLAYLGFTNQATRDGEETAAAFDPSHIYDLDLNAYTHDRLAITLKAVFGNVRASLARIENVEVLGGVYPAAYETFAYRPIAKALVRNTSSKPINAKVSFFVERYMDEPTESPAVYLLPGELREVPVTAVFNEQVRKVASVTVREGNVYVNATPAEQYDDRFQTRVLILGRNAWDGDAMSLRYFVTPDDPEVLRYSRDILLQHRDTVTQTPREMEAFRKARVLFDAFAGRLMYVNDPRLSSDFVQYPAETLQLRGGDCDDMTVLFASLLNSIGVATAFVDVVPPGRKGDSHIYLLIDTGLEPRQGPAVSENQKRYIVRRGRSGRETVWIPVETTATARGFDEAWTRGAQQYFDDVEVGLGLVKGWVRIVDGQ